MLSKKLKDRTLFDVLIEQKKPSDAAKILIDEAAKGFAMSIKAAVTSGAMTEKESEDFALMGLQFYELILTDMDENEFRKYVRCQG